MDVYPISVTGTMSYERFFTVGPRVPILLKRVQAFSRIRDTGCAFSAEWLLRRPTVVKVAS